MLKCLECTECLCESILDNTSSTSANADDIDAEENETDHIGHGIIVSVPPKAEKCQGRESGEGGLDESEEIFFSIILEVLQLHVFKRRNMTPMQNPHKLRGTQ